MGLQNQLSISSLFLVSRMDKGTQSAAPYIPTCKKGKRTRSHPGFPGDPTELVQVQQELPSLRGSLSLTLKVLQSPRPNSSPHLAVFVLSPFSVKRNKTVVDLGQSAGSEIFKELHGTLATQFT